jgi:diaminohydroxyphosphoribosylaminopyrimidine deaminase / 5-amino-6-(5-phosphoribosylamino)uracil reductase
VPFGPLERLADGVALRWLDSQAVGDDLRLRARVDGRDAFLTHR